MLTKKGEPIHISHGRYLLHQRMVSGTPGTHHYTVDGRIAKMMSCKITLKSGDEAYGAIEVIGGTVSRIILFTDAGSWVSSDSPDFWAVVPVSPEEALPMSYQVL